MITNKNIDEVLKKGYYDEIKHFFSHCNSKEDKIEYVKNRYGTGGWGIPEHGDFIDMVIYSPKGFEFSKRNGMKIETVKLSWKKVVERIEKIIENESQISLF